MSLARDAIKSVMLAHALPTIGLLFSMVILVWGAAHVALSSAYHNGYHVGAQVVRDSAVIATAKERRDSAVAHANAIHNAALHSDSILRAAVNKDSAAIAAPRHTPRFELLPDSLSRLPKGDLVRVIVENTGDTINAVPRRAAVLWFQADSMLGVAQRLLNKYAAANKSWSEAWAAEKQAREGADSLSALWRTRALANVAPPPRNMHRIAYLALGAVAGFLVAKRVH